METNSFEIDINATIEKVWLALTSSFEFNTWMKSVKVQTDWKQGSEITYTCYDTNGNVVKWDGVDMIWNGKIETLIENKELTCLYPSKSTGLEKESYFLEKVNDGKTKLIQIQILTSKHVADSYKDGTLQTLQFLKNYLESK